MARLAPLATLSVLAAVALARPATRDGPAPADLGDRLARVDAKRLERDVRTLAGFGTRHPLSATDDPAHGIGAARRWLEGELRAAADAINAALPKGSAPIASLRVQPFEQRVARGSTAVARFENLLLEIAGSDPARGLWIVGGHYDSRCRKENDGVHDAPGADDDASGTAVVLELARACAGERPLASVLLAAFDGEERGLFGSDELAAQLKREGRDVEGMVTNDIVGASRGPDRSAPAATFLRCFSEGFASGAEQSPFFGIVGGEVDGPSRQLARFAELAARRHVAGFSVRLMARADRFGRSGDHVSFTKRGFPAIRFTEAVEDYRHQHEDVRSEAGEQFGDLPEFVDFDYLAAVARVNLALVLEGAGAPRPPPFVHLDGAVKPDVTVEWGEAAGAAVAGYRVWRRSSDAATWHDDHFVPRGTLQLTLPGISIDDWQFAVSTVGDDGRESPVRFPTQKPRASDSRPAREGAGAR
jgi:hypothetical protein